MLHLRELDPGDADGIGLVAQRMRATLVEVEGEEVGGRMYSMEWLRERVLWHLNPRLAEARVVLAEDEVGQILGHTIFRVEAGASGEASGLISSTYVVPDARRMGVAQELLDCAGAWFRERGIASISTWTSATNTPLIALYSRNGYVEAERGANDLTGTQMVRLERRLAAPRRSSET
jgi:GNAT superfamily N-acetyltransferase